MGGTGVFTVSEVVQHNEKEKENGAQGKKEVDLEEALDIVGVGWYNVRYCILYAGFLISSILETAGYSYVLPAGRCDLGMSDAQRGLVSSLPYIAVVLSSHPWGYLADTRGRKPTLLVASLAMGTLGAAACFMPDIISFAVCKFIASLFMACPAGISYALIGEILPRRFRDSALSIVNASQILGSSAIPLLAWWILGYDFSVDFGLYQFRPWRVLGTVYSLSFVVCGLLLLSGPESPKYLVAAGRLDEALVVLRTMYAGNKGGRPEDFPVSAIKGPPPIESKDQKSVMASLRDQTLPLFRAPYLKWMVLNSVLLFGVFSTLNGLFMWVPDVLNRVLTGAGAGQGLTACQVIEARLNASAAVQACDDHIATSTFQINSIANTAAAVVSLLAGVSVQWVGKKSVLLFVYLAVGAACIAINFTTNTILFAVLLSCIQLTAICIGPVNAYSVAIFPTELRGMAVGLSIMFGRLGSVLGTNVAGLLINAACEATFFSFGGLLLVCGVLALLLPRQKK